MNRPSNNKKSENLAYRGLCHPSEPQIKDRRKPKDRQILGPCRRTKEPVKHESDDDGNCNWFTWNDLQRFGKGTGRLEIGGRIETIQTTALLR